MAKNSYVYEIINWEPINTNSMNLLAKVNIKPDIKLLELFKIAPLHNILCKISDTTSVYDNKVVYGKIDKSTLDDTYYITLDQVWFNYPSKNGKIEFLSNTVYQTIDYIDDKGSPNIEIEKGTTSLPNLNLMSTPDLDPVKEQTQSPKMKLSDILLPIGISLIVIGLLHYILPKKFLN
jgi:hypothetical protein